MLFGSGNVVFPLIVGKTFSDHYLISIVGWLLTAVIIPIFGYFGAFLFEGDHKKYLSPLGKNIGFLLMILLMAMAGPFGVMGRGVNVSFGGLHVVYPELSETLFNLTYCVLMTVIAWNPGKVVQIIGAIFTPLKFGGIATVTVGAMYFGMSFSKIPTTGTALFGAFYGSLKSGFQTMDLLASFIMGSAVYAYLKKSLPQDTNRISFLKLSAVSCLIGAIALSIAYAGLIVIGAQYSGELIGIPNESLFTKIAFISMGAGASLFVAIIIAVCCLATNIGLTSVFTDFVHVDILNKKYLSRNAVLLATGGITFVMSLLGFDQICKILGVILEAVYPALILFVILRIVYFFVKKMYN
jgi:LIVCS family branched-chain amino acid:cation transporter